MVWPREQPVLSDDVVLLRGVTEADAYAIFRACQDVEIQRFTQVPAPYQRSSADAFVALCEERWREGVTANFAVCDRATGDFLGVVGIIGADHEAGTAGVGYWTAPWGRGRHVTSRGVRLATDWALGAGALRTLTAEAETANPASICVLANAGYSRLDVPEEVIELKGSTRRFTSWQVTMGADDRRSLRRP